MWARAIEPLRAQHSPERVRPPAGWRSRLAGWVPLAAILSLVFAHVTDSGVSVCPYAMLTGKPCPGCGMTRALSHLMHGDLAGMWTLHPLAPLLVLEAAALAVYTTMRRRLPSAAALSWVLATDGLLLVAVWLARIAAGSLPTVTSALSIISGGR